MDKDKDTPKMTEGVLANDTDIQTVMNSITDTTQKLRLMNAKLINTCESQDGSYMELNTEDDSKVCELQKELVKMQSILTEMKKKKENNILRQNRGRNKDSGYYSATVSQGASSQVEGVGDLVGQGTMVDLQQQNQNGGPIQQESCYKLDSEQFGKTDQDLHETNDPDQDGGNDTAKSDIKIDSQC